MRTFVIAEPGCTHEGSFEAMTKLVKVAADAGCDAYKSQWMSDPQKVCERRDAPEYLTFYRWLAYPLHWHTHLKALCESLGMEYGCTTYLPEDREAIDEYVDFHKVASFENYAFGSREGKPVIIGAGMLTHEELSRLVATAPPHWRILQCTSSYPTPIESVNLATIRQYRLAGLSDHSSDVEMGALAVCAGAKIIETHMRLQDCDPANPDYAVALNPTELDLYVDGIRDAEKAMGYPLKQILPCEQAMTRFKVQA